MSFNTFGKIFRFTTWGESHGPAIGCVIDGCPPNIPLTEKDIQADMDRRRPGQSKFTTQRKEPDKAIILSGVFGGKTTGTPISIIIYNEDKKSRDYESIKNKFRPGHADYTYFKKYGIWSLLLAWVPVIGDPLTIIAGVLRVKFLTFLTLVSISKISRYVFLIFIVF